MTALALSAQADVYVTLTILGLTVLAMVTGSERRQ